MISRQCVSSGRHQDYGIFGPVQDSFRSSRPQQLIAGEVVSLKTLAADDVLDPTETTARFDTVSTALAVPYYFHGRYSRLGYLRPRSYRLHYVSCGC